MAVNPPGHEELGFSLIIWHPIKNSPIAMFSLIKTLSTSLADVQERHEKYLSEAVDMCDLEARMRHLDGGHRSIYRTGPYGVFMR
jgi:hypothetical protein